MKSIGIDINGKELVFEGECLPIEYGTLKTKKK